jgi:hypothetical protein
MELLITPAQVAQMAFRAPDFIPLEAVSEATILAAQQKFVRPVLGDALYRAVCGGAYPDLLADYLRPPLALYVKMLMLPRLAVQSGVAGVAEAASKNLARAADAKLRGAVRSLRSDAKALMRRAVEHLESSSPGTYPEYDPDGNILNRCSTEGGVVLPGITNYELRITRGHGKLC